MQSQATPLAMSVLYFLAKVIGALPDKVFALLLVGFVDLFLGKTQLLSATNLSRLRFG
jgi:hypothetical protein